MAPTNSAGEDIGMRRRRLRFRAWHRGTKEMDLIFGPFADARIADLDTAGLDRLETLMDEEDTELLKWVLGQEAPPEGVDVALLDELARFNRERLAK